MNKRKDKIQLEKITIFYGNTTIDDLLESGYKIKKENLFFHRESSSIMCGFFDGDIYMGELAIFNVDNEPPLKELKSKAIDLVLLENDENLSNKKTKVKKDTNFNEKINNQFHRESFKDFMEFGGRVGKKDIKLLLTGYLVCWFLILIGHKNIPKELIYITSFLPFGFFGMAYIFWMIKNFFSFLYHTIPRNLYILFCTGLFLLWSLICSQVIFESKIKENFINKIPSTIIFTGFFLSITVFLSYQILSFFLFNKKIKNQKELIKKYFPLHLILYVIAFIGKNHIKNTNNSFLVVLIIQFGIYCIMSFSIWIRILATSLIFKNK